jgi:transketolase N-terminal domain/subunit/phosphohistidine phosphatase SixA
MIFMASDQFKHIQEPEDLRDLLPEDLKVFAVELRQEIINIIAKGEGHLGSSLGTVELTIALHYCFNTPKDLIIWDVGHQAYGHKMITGRRKAFQKLRQRNGISGFPKRDESPYDTFGTGHAGTAISAALGMALSAKTEDQNRLHIAVVGDASIAGGEKKAKNSWIYKNEIAHAIDLNGDQIFGNPSKKPNCLSEAEYNNTAFENKLSDKKLLRKLQKGGLVIYMRHATTEKDYADQADPNLDLNDPSTQRMLSEQGIQEATSIGAGFKAGDILIGKVTSSEYQRAKDTAELAFGKYKEKSKLNFLPFEDYTDDQLDIYHDRVAPMLAKKPNNTKKNTVIVGHDDPFEGTTNIYPDPQGTAYVLNPRGDNFEILAQLKPNDWAFNADI